MYILSHNYSTKRSFRLRDQKIHWSSRSQLDVYRVFDNTDNTVTHGSLFRYVPAKKRICSQFTVLSINELKIISPDRKYNNNLQTPLRKNRRTVFCFIAIFLACVYVTSRDPVEKKKKTCAVSWIRRPSGDWSDECGWEYLYAQDTLTSRMGVANVTRPSNACNDWSDGRGVAICTLYSCSHYGGPPCHSRHGSPVPSRRYH